MSNIGSKIRFLREQKKLSRSELAEICGLTRHAMRKIEEDLTSPRLDTLMAILKNLGVSESSFFEPDANFLIQSCEEA